MKRLLLLLILSPVILFGQSRRQEVIDSIRAAAATNLQTVSTLIGSNPGTKVEHIGITDSAEYVTLVVRVHLKVDIAVVSLVPAAEIKVNAAAAGIITGRLPVPPLPDILPVTIEAIPARAALRFSAENAAVVTGQILPVPPLPDVLPVTIAGVPVLAVFKFSAENRPVDKAGTLAVPLLPAVVPEAVDAVALIAVAKFTTENTPAGKAGTLSVPPLPDIVPVMVNAAPPVVVIRFSIENTPVAKADTMKVPPLPEMVPEIEDLALHTAIPLDTAIHLAFNFDTMTVPDFEEKKMEVEVMHLSDDGYSLLQKLEGFSPELYSLKDGGFTIGFGFFVPYGEGHKWSKGLTWEQADRLIHEKVPTYEDQVKEYINVPLTQKEFDALTMLAYNLGGFSKATSIVNDINGQADFDKLQSDWKRFVHSKAPNVAKGLMNRRKDELEVRKASNYQPERKIQVLTNRH